MSVGTLFHGVGLALISLLGLVSNILHFIKFSKSIKRDIFDKILLQCMVFNVVALIFGFLLTSFALLLEHLEYHSNSHTGITQLNIFGAYTGLSGAAFSAILLLVERLLMSSYPKWHSRLNMIWISLVVTVSVCLLAKLHLLEYEIVCIGGYDGPHENVLGICPDGEKAYVTYSTLRSNTAYRAFVLLHMLVTSSLLPLGLIPFLIWQLHSHDKLADPRTRAAVVAGALLWGANLVQLVPVCYEVHSLSMDHSTWEFHTAMPGWIFNWYQVSHFMAMCLPAVYPWVFSGPQLLTAWMDQSPTVDREMLIQVHVEDEEGGISLKEGQEQDGEGDDMNSMNCNPAYQEENN